MNTLQEAFVTNFELETFLDYLLHPSTHFAIHIGSDLVFAQTMAKFIA